MAQNWGRRQTWQAAGGSAPAFGAVDVGGGAAAIGLGTTGLVQASSFTQLPGKECDASCRIVLGIGATGATGLVSVTGLPVLPNPDIAQNGRIIGHGWLLDASGGAGYQMWDVLVLIDALFGDNPTLVVPRDANGAPNAYGDFSAAVHDTNPFTWAAGDVMNLTMRYEGI